MIVFKPWQAWVIGFCGCLALAWLCAELHIEGIEDDLVARTETALRPLKIGDLQVSADGRDIVLEGEVASEGLRQMALARAVAVEGVFTVTSRIRVAKPATSTETLVDPMSDCCEADAPEKEKPGSKGDRAFSDPSR